MANKEIRDLLQKWAKRDGLHIVKSRLIAKRLSTTFVDQVIADRYPNEIQGANLTVIEDELRKAGFIQDEAG
jgi:hypothetical protein